MSQFVWRTAAQALSENAVGKLSLMLPTRQVLREIADFADVDALLDFAACRRGIMPFTPEFP